MKKAILTSITLLMAFAAIAQSPDAEYNLIRRSYRVNNDGSMDIRFRKEITLLRNRAITAYADKGETFITYNPAFESLTINECYTIDAKGQKVVTPQNAFVLQLPGECTDCGRLNDIREMAIVHTGLEYNCTIVLDYTLHRNTTLLAERFNLNQDCPVKRYEIRYADGHTDLFTNLPQTINEPYMVAPKGYDVEFQLGNRPVFTAETTLPSAAPLINSLRKDNDKDFVAAIRDWVVDYVHLNNIDLARVNYAITPAAEVFASNCGTYLDKTGLLAAMLNQAGFSASIVDNSLNVFGDRPLEVEVTILGQKYLLSATQKSPILTQNEKADAQAVASSPVYIDRSLEWKPDTIVDGYARITLPDEPRGLKINPSLLSSKRLTDLQASNASEFYHYTLELPKGVKLIGGDVNIEYTKPNIGSLSIIIKQKGKRILITRSLRLRKAVISKSEYNDFRQMMVDWNSHKELLFTL